jgi:transcriptional regulator with XRE-family HTH domain
MRKRRRRPSRASLLSEYMSRETLADELGVCERTIARYERDLVNPLPFTEVGGRNEYHRALVKQWLERRGKRRNPRPKPKAKPNKP